MRRMFSAFLFIIVLSSTFIFASNPSEKDKLVVSQNTIQSLINGIESNNTGLKTSSAYMIGELKITSAVIPLMEMMRNDDSEEARIVAALSLYKIGTPLAMNAVRQAIRFDRSERVKRMCLKFYNDYLSKSQGI